MYYSTFKMILLAVPLELRNSSEVHLLLTPPAYDCLQMTYVVPYKPSARTYRKHVTWSLFTVVWCHCLCRNVFTKPLLRNGLHNPFVPPLLGTDDIENTASSIVACWTVFPELLPGNALIKSVNSILNCFPIQTWQSNGAGNKITLVWCILNCQKIRLCRFTLIPLVDGYVIGNDVDSTCQSLYFMLSHHSISSGHHVVIFHFSKNILLWTYYIFLTSLYCNHAGVAE
jgi:hypothetical protein